MLTTRQSRNDFGLKGQLHRFNTSKSVYRPWSTTACMKKKLYKTSYKLPRVASVGAEDYKLEY